MPAAAKAAGERGMALRFHLRDMLGVSVEIAAEMAAEKAAQSRDRRKRRRAKIIQLRLDRAAKGAQ